jgi:superfamily II DNA or RNA helicase
MTDQGLLSELRNRGLRAWQATFVASFMNADPPAFQLLAAPPGTGKMFAAVAAVRELAARGAKRILVLAPAYLCEAWRTKIGDAQSHLPVSSVSRQTYREMEAAVPIGQSPWAASGVFVISQDFAKQPDIVASLSKTVWDLVAVDEAHRFAARQRSTLLEQLVSAGVIRRLLLLTATPLPALDHWLRPSQAQPSPLSTPPAVTSWYGALQNWDGSVVERQRVDWEVVRYTRGTDEIRFLAKLLEVAQALAVASSGNQFLSQLLIQRAASSTYAAELSLGRLRHTLRSRVTNITAPIEPDSDADADSEDFETEGKSSVSNMSDASSALKLVDQCLQALESVESDEKLSALKALVRSITEANPGQSLRMCIFSMYVDTVDYLHSALEYAGTHAFKITGRDSFAGRAAIVEGFQRAGGLLVGTDGGSEGIELRDVTHVIHYDVPTNPMIMEQRRGRVDRYGRTTPCTMYLFRDDSGTITFESEVIDHLHGTSAVD